MHEVHFEENLQTSSMKWSWLLSVSLEYSVHTFLFLEYVGQVWHIQIWGHYTYDSEGIDTLLDGLSHF